MARRLSVTRTEVAPLGGGGSPLLRHEYLLQGVAYLPNLTNLSNIVSSRCAGHARPCLRGLDETRIAPQAAPYYCSGISPPFSSIHSRTFHTSA